VSQGGDSQLNKLELGLVYVRRVALAEPRLPCAKISRPDWGEEPHQPRKSQLGFLAALHWALSFRVWRTARFLNNTNHAGRGAPDPAQNTHTCITLGAALAPPPIPLPQLLIPRLELPSGGRLGCWEIIWQLLRYLTGRGPFGPAEKKSDESNAFLGVIAMP